MNSSPETPEMPTCEYEQNILILRGLPIFDGMSVETLKALAYFCKRLKYKPGDFVFHQGDEEEQAYYIIAGKLELLRREDAEGKADADVSLGTLGPEKLFGSLALLSEVKRLFSLRAVEPTTLLVLPRKQFLTNMRDNPDFARKFMKTLTRQITKWEENTFLKGSCTVERSLANVGVSLI